MVEKSPARERTADLGVLGSLSLQVLASLSLSILPFY